MPVAQPIPLRLSGDVCASLSGTRRHYARFIPSWQIAEIWPAAAWNGGAARRQAACRHTCGVFTLTDLSISALVTRLTSLICRAAHPSVVSFRRSVVSSHRFVEQRTDLPFLLTDLSNSTPICRFFSPICRAAHLSVVSSYRFVEQRTDLPFLLTDLSNSAPICRSVASGPAPRSGGFHTAGRCCQNPCDMEIAPTAGRRCPNPLHSSPTDDVRYGNRTYGRSALSEPAPFVANQRRAIWKSHLRPGRVLPEPAPFVTIRRRAIWKSHRRATANPARAAPHPVAAVSIPPVGAVRTLRPGRAGARRSNPPLAPQSLTINH